MPDTDFAGAATRLPRIAARLFEEPLLLHPRKLQTIVQVLTPRLFASLEGAPTAKEAAKDPFLGAHSKPVDPGQHSIAVIPIHGTLIQRGDSLDAASGLLSYDAIREDFDEALARTDIDAILFDIDSGGGEASGVFDLCDYIFSCRGQKPIYSFVNEHAYSAAYALASTADKIFLPRTGGVGSIGVVAVHLNQSGLDEKNGLQYTPVFAGACKIDGWPHSALSKEAQDRMQARVDKVYGIFTATVARYRGLAEKSVIDTQASCYDGTDAIKAGLADGIASFDEVLETLLTDLEQRQVSGPFARESRSGLPGETPNHKAKGEKTMPLKNLVMGRINRALHTQESSEPEKENPVETEEDVEPAETDAPPEIQEGGDVDKPQEGEEDDDIPENDEPEAPEILQARTDGRKESLEIMSLCKLYGKPELAEAYVRKGYSASQVRKHLLAKRNTELKATSPASVISNRQSTRAHSGSGGVVAAVKQKLKIKE